MVPEEIATWLSPLAVAIWFMDDGAADYAGVTLQTHDFEPEEVDHLATVLRENFGLAVNSRGNKGGRILYVKAASLPRLKAIVGPYLLAEFRYKLIPRRNRTP